MNKVEVGKYYESENGHKWRCIAVEGSNSWLTPADSTSTAFLFNTDGTNISQGGGEWNIKFDPVVEWNTAKASVSWVSDFRPRNYTFYIKFPTINGNADFTQAKVEGAQQ